MYVSDFSCTELQLPKYTLCARGEKTTTKNKHALKDKAPIDLASASDTWVTSEREATFTQRGGGPPTKVTAWVVN